MGLRHLVFAVGLALLLASCAALEGLAAPDSKLISAHWLQNDPGSTQRLDHTLWNQFLAAYVVPGVDGVNRVTYARVDTSGRALLESYIASLAAAPVSRLSRAEQLAYWIDLYNAVTMRVVLDRYPVASIRDIALGPGLFTIGPWDAKLIMVEGEGLSLNDIEHGILRPIWHDPRTHYALNCASIGCPKLQPIAFTAKNANRLLDESARDYINNPHGVRIVKGRLIVSSLYRWYRGDFGSGETGVMDHLKRYAAPELAAELARFREPDDDAYDWRLIDAR